MNSWTELRQWCHKKATSYPEHKEEINDLYQLARDEFEDGGSREHEIASCISSVEELTQEEEDDDSCPHCVGTGISPSGRVDDSCNYCGGSGVERQDYED